MLTPQRLLHNLLVSLAITAAVFAGGLTLGPASAEAAESSDSGEFVVSGAGWGHGIGMSQYGARGYAERGRKYDAILAHYYQGTRLQKRSHRVVRVLLQANQSVVKVKGATVVGSRRLQAKRTYRFTLDGDRAVLSSATGRKLNTYGSSVIVQGQDLTLIGEADNGVVDGRYRGSLQVRVAKRGGLNAINLVGSETYLRGVVPAEIPASWPVEALKAQAVAARSYAFSTAKYGEQFDQYADTRSQMYRGISGETRRTDIAVKRTSRRVVTYESRVIPAYFFSTSGGRTENIENVWRGASPRPYLRSVPDPYDTKSPYHRWEVDFTREELERKLGSLVKGKLLSIETARTGASPRVIDAVVRGTEGDTRTTGAVLQFELGLRDRWFVVSESATSTQRAVQRASTSVEKLSR